jgi:hypothetical protein
MMQETFLSIDNIIWTINYEYKRQADNSTVITATINDDSRVFGSDFQINKIVVDDMKKSIENHLTRYIKQNVDQQCVPTESVEDVISYDDAKESDLQCNCSHFNVSVVQPIPYSMRFAIKMKSRYNIHDIIACIKSTVIDVHARKKHSDNEKYNKNCDIISSTVVITITMVIIILMLLTAAGLVHFGRNR